MTDSCSRRKMRFCKLTLNNVNRIMSLTWKPNWCSSVSFGVWLPLVPYKKHNNRGWLDQIIVIRQLNNDRPKHNFVMFQNILKYFSHKFHHGMKVRNWWTWSGAGVEWLLNAWSAEGKLLPLHSVHILWSRPTYACPELAVQTTKGLVAQPTTQGSWCTSAGPR